MDSAHVHGDEVLEAKAPYLNQTFFFIRAAFYFIVWTVLAWFLYSRSVKQDNLQGDLPKQAVITRTLWKVSAGGIFLFALTQSFAAFDWMMSLQPHWYSTMFGVYYFAGSILAFHAMTGLVSVALQKAGLLKGVVTTEHYHDIGKFMFGYTIFWAYITFSQFFLIWYANMPEETIFFLRRTENGWDKLSYALPLIHFFVPFLFLLSRHVKRNRPALVFGAFWLLAVHALDLYFVIMPNVSAPHGAGHVEGHGVPPFAFSILDVTAMVGVAGIFLAVFGFFLKKNKVLAAGDPRLYESMALENY